MAGSRANPLGLSNLGGWTPSWSGQPGDYVPGYQMPANPTQIDDTDYADDVGGWPTGGGGTEAQQTNWDLFQEYEGMDAEWDAPTYEILDPRRGFISNVGKGVGQSWAGDTAEERYKNYKEAIGKGYQGEMGYEPIPYELWEQDVVEENQNPVEGGGEAVRWAPTDEGQAAKAWNAANVADLNAWRDGNAKREQTYKKRPDVQERIRRETEYNTANPPPQQDRFSPQISAAEEERTRAAKAAADAKARRRKEYESRTGLPITPVSKPGGHGPGGIINLYEKTPRY